MNITRKFTALVKAIDDGEFDNNYIILQSLQIQHYSKLNMQDDNNARATEERKKIIIEASYNSSIMMLF
jgi:hypothetical protein